MKQSQLIWGLVVVFAGIALAQVAMGVLYTPVLFVVAVPFAAASYLLWYHVSGRMARNVRTRARERSAWEDARAEAQAAERGTGPGSGTGATAGAGGADGGRRTRARPDPDRMAPEAAYRALGLDPGADDAAVQRAYRERVKETHPDRADGDEEAFKRVTRAYERLKLD